MPRSVVEHLEKLLAGQPLNRDDLVWFLLAAGLLFATAHLLTMFITRWGDSRITAKSLVLSLLMHLTCGLGLVSMEPVPLPPARGDSTPDVDEFVEVREVLTPEEEQIRFETAGNTPFWEETRRDVDLARIDPLNDPTLMPEPAQRSELATNRLDVPDSPTIPDDPNAAPETEQSSDEPQRTAADADGLLDEFERADPLALPMKVRDRLQVDRSGLQTEDVDRQVRSGAAERIAERLDPTRTLQSPDLPRNDSSEVPRPEGQLADSYELRDSPIESRIPQEDPGATVEAGNTGRRTRPNSLERFNLRQKPGGDSTSESSTEVARRTPERSATESMTSTGRSALDVPPAGGIGGLGNSIMPLEMPEAAPRRKGEVAPTYQLRDLARRRDAARRFGGTEQSEKAVEDSLRWLSSVQTAAGYWDADQFDAGQVRFDENRIDREYAGRDSDTGVTALAMLAFLGAGYTHEVGQYSDHVDRAINWLIDQQGEDGNLFGRANHFAQMYCHGMATYALAEAYGMQSDPGANPRLRQAVEKGIAYIIRLQNPRDGGWRYGPDQAGDMSMFGWQLMALKSAEIAGIPVPAQVKSRLAQFLNQRSLGSSRGLASYRTGEPVSLPMTAEALFCKQMMGLPRSDPASTEAVNYVLRSLPERTDYNLYYWYYGTLAMYQYGGREWEQWNSRTRDLIISLQSTSGPFAGSWEPRSRWGPYGGRIYTTAVSTLCLEVYYRLLPLYRIGEPNP